MCRYEKGLWSTYRHNSLGCSIHAKNYDFISFFSGAHGEMQKKEPLTTTLDFDVGGLIW